MVDRAQPTNRCSLNHFKSENFPRFDGSDVPQWTFQADQSFDYYHTPKDQRITTVAVHIQGCGSLISDDAENQPIPVMAWQAFMRGQILLQSFFFSGYIG